MISQAKAFMGEMQAFGDMFKFANTIANATADSKTDNACKQSAQYDAVLSKLESLVEKANSSSKPDQPTTPSKENFASSTHLDTALGEKLSLQSSSRCNAKFKVWKQR